MFCKKGGKKTICPGVNPIGDGVWLDLPHGIQPTPKSKLGKNRRVVLITFFGGELTRLFLGKAKIAWNHINPAAYSTSLMSKPRWATSVATKIWHFPWRKLLRMASRSAWSLSPWIAPASNCSYRSSRQSAFAPFLVSVKIRMRGLESCGGTSCNHSKNCLVETDWKIYLSLGIIIPLRLKMKKYSR